MTPKSKARYLKRYKNGSTKERKKPYAKPAKRGQASTITQEQHIDGILKMQTMFFGDLRRIINKKPTTEEKEHAG